MGNLIEGLQKQMNRNRELLKIYETIPTGSFAIAMIEAAIRTAEEAIANGDIVMMVRCFKDLENSK